MEFGNIVSLLVGIVTLSVIFLYCRRNSIKNARFWLDKSIPYLKMPLFFIGIVPVFTKKFYWEFDVEWCKKFGRIFGTFQAGRPCLYVTEPEILRKILVKDFHMLPEHRTFKLNDPIQETFLPMLNGDDWKRVRSVISPSFSTGKLKKMVALMDECAVRISENLGTISEKSSTADCMRLFESYTLDVIASTAFGTNLNSNQDPENVFIQHCRQFTNPVFPWRFMLVLLFPKITGLLKFSALNQGVMKFFIDLVNTVVQKRKETKEDRGDFLQNLIEAQLRGSNAEDLAHEEQIGESLDKDALSEECQSFLKQYSKNKTLTADEFVGTCVLFLMVGFGTTSSALAMIVYYLALNPECQAKLVEEVDNVWKKNPKMDYENLSKLKYMDAVISEVLRLVPISPRLERQAVGDYPLPEANLTVSKEMIVVIPIYAMHRDPEFFPDPEKFDPERFLPENKETIRPYTYMPFGVGPRNCIGMRFALLETKVCLFQIFRKVTFEPCAETKIPPDIVRGGGLLQPKSVPLKVIKRH